MKSWLPLSNITTRRLALALSLDIIFSRLPYCSVKTYYLPTNLHPAICLELCNYTGVAARRCSQEAGIDVIRL